MKSTSGTRWLGDSWSPPSRRGSLRRCPTTAAAPWPIAKVGTFTVEKGELLFLLVALEAERDGIRRDAALVWRALHDRPGTGSRPRLRNHARCRVRRLTRVTVTRGSRRRTERQIRVNRDALPSRIGVRVWPGFSGGVSTMASSPTRVIGSRRQPASRPGSGLRAVPPGWQAGPE